MDSAGNAAGSQFGRYRLLRLLGAGGFGEVYVAEDTVMGRQVALKLIAGPYSHDPVFRERLFREARTAGRLTEPHIVPVHGCGEVDGRLYIDMRLIDGTDLATVLADGGPLPPARAVAIVQQVAAALDAAHAAEMIHRDIKPSNILLTDDDFACLVDFGLASTATDTKLTKTGTTIGSFGYLAPERLTHNSPVGPPADVYALACVLYECLTGSAPYLGADLPGLISAHLTAPIPKPSDGLPGLPAAFDQVVARGMAKDPTERFSSAGELSGAAQAALVTTDHLHAAAPTQAAAVGGSPGSTGPGHPTPPQQDRSRRTAWIVGGAVAALVAATAGGLGYRLSRPPNCSAAQQAAVAYAELLTGVDYHRLDDYFAAVLGGATGEFKRRYAESETRLRQRLTDNRAVAHASAVESAVQTCAPDRSVILLLVDQTLTNTSHPEPQVDRSRVKMTMTLVNGRWLASQVDTL